MSSSRAPGQPHLAALSVPQLVGVSELVSVLLVALAHWRTHR